MPTYQVTTDKGTYQVDTQNSGQSSSTVQDTQGTTIPQSGQSPIQPQTQSQSQQSTSTAQTASSLSQASSSLDNIDSQPPPIQQSSAPQGSMIDQMYTNIAQFGKNAYSVTPFAKRIAQITGSGADQVYAGVGQPQGILQNISAMAGQMAPQIALATPFMKGAAILSGAAQDALKTAIPGIAGKIAGGVVGSPMMRGAAGLGSYSGAKTALTNGSGKQVLDNTIQGMQQGIIYGALGKIGATIMPTKIFGKYAETAGSAVGGAIAGAMTSSGGDDAKAQALFQGALSALTPEEKFDFHKMVANNVTPVQWQKYLRTGLQISPEDTKTILNNGINEVQRVGEMQIPIPNQTTGGQDILGPVQIAQKFYQNGIQEIRQKLGTQFDDAIKANASNNPTDINDFVAGLKKQVDNYADPTSPIVTRFNKTYNSLQGFQPTTTETEISGNKEQPNVASPNLRQVNINELPKSLQGQVRQQLGLKGDITNLSLNSLHELKQNLYDAVSDKTWRDPGNTTPEERFAKSLGGQIGEYIGKNNDLYQKSSKDWARMKSVQSDISSLNTNNLGKDWASLAPANKIDMDNNLNGISSYFKSNGVSQYDPKGLLDKYHAWNAINNPDPTSFRNNAPLKIAFDRGSSIMGAALGLPFGLHGAAIGGAIGYMSAIHYMRPSSYIEILRHIEPNMKIPSSMNSDEALSTLKELIIKQGAGTAQVKK